MTHPTPPAAASDFAIAQAFRESQGRLNPLHITPSSQLLLTINQRAAEIQSAQPSGVAIPAAYERGGKVVRTLMEAEKTQFYGDGPIFPLYRHPPIAPPIAQQGGGEAGDAMVEAACAAFVEEHGGYRVSRTKMRAALTAALASKADGETK